VNEGVKEIQTKLKEMDGLQEREKRGKRTEFSIRGCTNTPNELKKFETEPCKF
jgi:hypothetical protein